MQEERSQVSDNEFPLQEEEEEGGIPFDASPEQQHYGPVDSSLLSPDDATPVTAKRRSIAIDGLELDVSAATATENENEEPSPAPKKAKRKARVGPKRNRKRRRIDVDNDNSELTSKFIKDMLRDTSDIVQQNRVHPADYIETDEDAKARLPDYLLPRRERMMTLASARGIASLPYERLLARPNCADCGTLAPSILKVWERNSARIRGKPFPYKMRGEAGEEQRRQLAEEKIKNTAAQEAEDESIEIGRRDDASMMGSEGRLSMDLPPENDKTMEEEGAEFPQAEEEEDFPMPFEEEEEEGVAQHEMDGGAADQFASDMPGMESPTPSQNSQKSEFSLGAVNDLEADLADTPRQEQSDDLVSSDTKWHKHTVKVLGMLKRNMDSDCDENELELSEKAKELSYNKLSYGTSRRTACGVFFELLQLKTWDFIELQQEQSYGDIKITPGTRFSEQPPTE